jgi:hypothetical protein
VADELGQSLAPSHFAARRRVAVKLAQRAGVPQRLRDDRQSLG